MMSLGFVSILMLQGAPLLAQPPAATEPGHTAAAKGEFLLAPKVGLFKSSAALDPTFFAALELGYASTLLGHRLSLAFDVEFATSPTSGTVSDPQLTFAGKTADGGYRLDERQIGLSVSVIFRGLGLSSWFVPYGGLGPGLVFHHATTKAFGTTNEESEGSFGFHVLAGGEIQVGPGGVFLESRYRFTQIDFITTGKANVGGFAASVGYRFRF